jgi:hypothetical protein
VLRIVRNLLSAARTSGEGLGDTSGSDSVLITYFLVNFIIYAYVGLIRLTFPINKVLNVRSSLIADLATL